MFDKKIYDQGYRRDHKAELKIYFHNHSLKVKRLAFEIVSNGNIRCAVSDCGCDDLAVLELNYKPGGHTRLEKSGDLRSGIPLYRDIINGRVNTSLFEVMCKPHNSIAHLSHAKNFQIKWRKL